MRFYGSLESISGTQTGTDTTILELLVQCFNTNYINICAHIVVVLTELALCFHKHFQLVV